MKISFLCDMLCMKLHHKNEKTHVRCWACHDVLFGLKNHCAEKPRMDRLYCTIARLVNYLLPGVPCHFWSINFKNTLVWRSDTVENGGLLFRGNTPYLFHTFLPHRVSVILKFVNGTAAYLGLLSHFSCLIQPCRNYSTL